MAKIHARKGEIQLMLSQNIQEVEEFDDLHPKTQEFVKNDLDYDHLANRLEGRDGGLRPSKPKAKNDSGIEQYVWRMARFHSGHDPKMPVMAGFDLERALEEKGYIEDRRDDQKGEIDDILDAVSRLIVAKEFGINPNGGLERWEKALYG